MKDGQLNTINNVSCIILYCWRLTYYVAAISCAHLCIWFSNVVCNEFVLKQCNITGI